MMQIIAFDLASTRYTFVRLVGGLLFEMEYDIFAPLNR
jgi:hypothetical protein